MLLKSYILLIFIVLSIVDATLTPDKKKDKQKVKERKPEVKEDRFVKDDAAKDELLNADDQLPTDERHFTDGITLGYVTPWNNHGYDVAKVSAKKFTHISPVWFQINEGSDGLACEIAGTHDLDHGWIEDVRANNPDIQIVPRFLFEKWDSQLQSF